MKKTTLLLMVLLAGLTPVKAQTDVTRFFLTNYGFDDHFDYPATSSADVAQEIKTIDGWTQGFTHNYTITGVYEFGFQGTFNGGTIPAKGYDGEAGGGLALSTGWNELFPYTQELTLPAGSYTVSVPTYNGKGVTGGTSLLAWIPSSGSQVKSSVKSYPSNQWTLDKITFTLTKATAGKLQIGYQAVASGSVNSANLVIDYVKIEGTNVDAKPLLKTVIDEANTFYGEGNGNGAAELKSAIDAAQAVYDDEAADVATVLQAKLTLADAITDYRNKNISEENPLDVTELVSNPSFENGFNGWTQDGLQTQTNTSFARKAGTTYVEKWVGQGTKVGDASVTQTVALPAGRYKLTVAAQNLNQSSTSQRCTGAYIFADDQQEPVYTPNDYSVTFTSISGQVEIGFKAVGATGNWLAVDNFRLYQIGAVDSEAILAEVARLVQMGESLQSSMMSTQCANALQEALAAAKALTAESEQTDIQAAVKALQAAIDAATVSVAEYAALQEAIAAAEQALDSSKDGATDFQEAIEHAKALAQNGDATSEELAAEIEALTTAELLFQVANGSGTAPTVTTNTTFYIPAAHGALLRGSFSGTAFKERGFCWSTDPEPTIADHRCTFYYNQKGLLFHIKDMQPATVYYVRAYAISSTYAVGYGKPMKIVTLPQGSCVGTWDEGAPDEAANARCRKAIQETMDYLNEWTAIKGFTLSGHYGASTPTADCSYGGWMRIGPNAGNQAIGTVIHETGHGVGVGTHWRWYDCTDTRESEGKYGKWLGAWANKTLHFLENTSSADVFMTGDAVHGWGTNASYDWFVNGADKDTHQAIQYIGGCALLYSLYIDGLCPTTGYANGVPGYTFNFDENKKYYIKSEGENYGLNDGFVAERKGNSLRWGKFSAEQLEALNDSAAWYPEFVPSTGHYRFRNAATGKYISHTTSSLSLTATGSTSCNFQLMPGRNDVVVTGEQAGQKYTTPSYWMTFTTSNNNYSMQMSIYSQPLDRGSVSVAGFNYSNAAVNQRYIFVSEDDIDRFNEIAIPDGIRSTMAGAAGAQPVLVGIYTAGGARLSQPARGINVYRYSDGTSRVVIR